MLRGILFWCFVAALAPTSVGGQERCPRLFGSEETHARNRAYRQRNLHWTRKEPSGITVVHSNPRWEDVAQLSFEGIRLEGRGDDGRVTVVLSKKLADEYGCTPGRHVIRRDDCLGGRTRALALLGDYVLLTHRGKLGFLAPPEAKRPRWLLAWTLRGVTIYPSRGGKVRRKPPKRAHKRPPRRPPKRPPQRKRPPRKHPHHEARKARKR